MKKYLKLLIVFVMALIVVPNIINAEEKQEITRVNVHIKSGTQTAVFGQTLTQPEVEIVSTVPAEAKNHMTLRSSTGWHLDGQSEPLENGHVFTEGIYELWVSIELTSEGNENYTIGCDTDIYLDESVMDPNACDYGTVLKYFEYTLDSPSGTKPTITSDATLDSINKGENYFKALTAKGSKPITWSVKSGSSLPSGLSLDEDGFITGAPTVSGNFTFTLVATNEGGTDEKTFNLTITNKELITRVDVSVATGTASPVIGGTLTQPTITVTATTPAAVKDSLTVNYSSTGWHNTSGAMLENGFKFEKDNYLLWIYLDLASEAEDSYTFTCDTEMYLNGTEMFPNACGTDYLLRDLLFNLHDKYTVTFNTNGGPSISPVEVYEDSLVPADVLPPEDEMVKEGYTFGGWYKDAKFTEVFEFESDRINSNMTIYARWISNTKYTVTLVANNGIDTECTLPGFSEDDEWIIELPSVYEFSTPAGYEFAGWKINDVMYNAGDSYYIKGNVTVVAQWKQTVNLKELKQTGASKNSVTLKWNKNDSAKGYIVQVKNGKKWKTVSTITNKNTTSITVKKLKAGTKYTYRVQAYKNVKKKNKKVKETILTTDKVTAITKPSNPKATIKGSAYDYVKVSYKNKVKGASYYVIQRSTSKKGTYTTVGSFTGTYKDTDVKTGTRYYYKVKACNANNYCSGWSNLVDKKPSLAKPELTVKSNTKGTVTIKAGTVSGEDGYVIEYSTKSNKDFKEVANLDVHTKEYLHEGLKSKKVFYYRVRAYRVVDGKPAYGSWSKTKKVEVK